VCAAKITILPGQVGLDVSSAIDSAVAELKSCDRLVFAIVGARKQLVIIYTDTGSTITGTATHY